MRIACLPHLLSNDQKIALKNFIDVILNELINFKKENDIQTTCFEIKNTNKGDFNSLTISLPRHDLYKAFIHLLANKKFLPELNIHQEPGKSVRYPAAENLFMPGNSMLPKLTPSGIKRAEEENILTPFKKKPTPKCFP